MTAKWKTFPSLIVGVACCFASAACFPAVAAEAEDDPIKACPGATEFYQKKMQLVSQRETARKQPVLPKLRAQLLQWETLDQEVRKGITAEMMADPLKWKQVSQRMQAVDELNYRRIHDVIDEYGYPTREMVGVDGEKAAFLLVQHQTGHLEFMQFVLDIMAPLAKRSEVDSENFALLTDRVLANAQHKPQRYGSQFHGINGGTMEMQPVEDPEHLDERRAEVGLPPIAMYRCILERTYHVSVK